MIYFFEVIYDCFRGSASDDGHIFGSEQYQKMGRGQEVQKSRQAMGEAKAVS